MSEDCFATKTGNTKPVQEGRAKVLLPPNVFYNPVQEFNRDLTIAVISQTVLERCNLVDASDESDQKGQEIASRVDIAESHLEEKFTTSGVEREKRMSVDPSVDLKLGGQSEAGVRILEGLAASGLRSVRFALEIPGVKVVVANDFDRTAVEYIKQNSQLNNVEELVRPSCADAAMLMYQSRHSSNQFDVVDLDPYGSPAAFLDAAVQSVRSGGLLCVTCTDMAVLCGNATETCHAKYGSISLRSKFCHEMALRILLQSIESHANRYSRFIVPLLSVSVDFYCRVFVRIFTGQIKVKDSAAKLSTVYHCNGCGMFALQPVAVKVATRNGNFKYAAPTGPPVEPRCRHCNGRFNIGGPIWSAPIHDRHFVQTVIDSVEKRVDKFGTSSRILGILNVVSEELEDQPLYFDTDHLCSVLHCMAIGFIPMRSALLHRGYAVSLSHANKKSLKTDAPSDVIWDILRCWVKKNPVRSDHLQKGSIAEMIISKEPSFEADFSVHPDANPASRKKGLVRWQLNPEKDWGPKPRAARNTEAVKERKQIQDLKCLERKSKRKADNEEALHLMVKDYPCKRFLKGACDLGSTCQYSHAEDMSKADGHPD